MALICGLNGVGKSTLLRLVEGSISGSMALDGRCRPELIHEGKMTLTLSFNGSETILELGADSSETSPVVVIDAFEACGRMLSIGQQPNFGDLLAGVDSSNWQEEELRLASYVTAKSYKRVEVFEVEVPTPLDVRADQLVPYFSVADARAEYDSFSMGMGELAALMTLWRLLTAETGSIVLLEEPETFLSSRSSISIMDVLARQIDKKNLYGVVTTHSPELMSRVPLANTVILHPTIEGPTVMSTPTSRAQVLHLLGASAGQVRCVFTEDRMARRLTRELLARASGVWGRSVVIIEAGDESTVRLLCRRIPITEDFRVVGVLDGDQEVDAQADQWPLVSLPGPDNPDQMLRAAALGDLTRFSAAMSRDTTALAIALQACEGSDEHDWFPDMGAALALDEVSVLQAAIDCWLQTDTGSAQALIFVDALVAALGT